MASARACARARTISRRTSTSSTASSVASDLDQRRSHFPVHRHHRHPRHAHLHCRKRSTTPTGSRTTAPGSWRRRPYRRSRFRSWTTPTASDSTISAPSQPRPPRLWVDVNDFNLAQKTLWYNKLFGISVSNYNTFTMSAMLRIGNLFQNGGSGGLPASVNPLPAAAKDPITLSCQNNYHILITDGFTNEPTPAAQLVGEQDAIVPDFSRHSGHSAGPGAAEPAAAVRQPVAEAVRPGDRRPVANTLSDIATYYWATDLRPGMKNDVPSSSGKGTGDLDPTKDVAWWQHVSFSAISFGSEGMLDASQRKATLAAITAGTQSWPDLTNPNSPVNPARTRAPRVSTICGTRRSIRAASSSTRDRRSKCRTASPASSPASRTSVNRGSARRSPGQVLDATNNTIYEATIEPGWAGDLLKVQIDPTTAKEVAHAVASQSGAGAQIAQYISPAATPTVPPSQRPRAVVHQSAPRHDQRCVGQAGGVPRHQAVGHAARDARRHAAAAESKSLPICAAPRSTTPALRIPRRRRQPSTSRSKARASASSANASARSATSPMASPSSSPRPRARSSTRTIRDTRRTRPGRGRSGQRAIVAPANDGIVHVIDSNDGHEIMGFIPKALMRSTVDSAGKPDGIQALTYQDGGVPIYKHHFYVDSSPRTSDVDFNSAGVKGGGSRLAHDRRRRPRQGRQQLLRAGPHRSGCDRRGRLRDRRPARSCGR